MISKTYTKYNINTIILQYFTVGDISDGGGGEGHLYTPWTKAHNKCPQMDIYSMC